MSNLLPLLVGLAIFVVCLLLSYLGADGEKREVRKGAIAISLLVSILSGICINVISDWIKCRVNPGLCPEESSEATQPTSTSTETTSEPTEPEETTPEPTKPKIQYQIGDIITFGAYTQDSRGSSPIEWIILDIDNEKMLVISRYALDQQKYNAKDTDVTWKTSSIRQWLNGTFYNAAFTAEDQNRIEKVTVSADRNPYHNTDPGGSTKDKVFLLSIEEAERYFDSDTERICRATIYAINQGAYESTKTGGSWWWLRSPGSSGSDAASVNSDGSIDYDDGSVASAKGTVRPAMWINLE